jgi:hypothetical protein
VAAASSVGSQGASAIKGGGSRHADKLPLRPKGSASMISVAETKTAKGSSDRRQKISSPAAA